jgi:hypothetical protein
VGRSTLADISLKALRLAYEGPDQPSVASLAQRWRVGRETIRRRLRHAGIPVRSAAEQGRIDLRNGRRLPPVARGVANQSFLEAGVSWSQRNPEAASAKAKRAAAIHAARCRQRLITRPCGYCGAPLSRSPAQAARCVSFACPEHRGKVASYKGSGKPLPALVEHLQSAGAAARTWEQLEPIAASMGAGEAEIECILMGRFAVASMTTPETETPGWLRSAMLEART